MPILVNMHDLLSCWLPTEFVKWWFWPILHAQKYSHKFYMTDSARTNLPNEMFEIHWKSISNPQLRSLQSTAPGRRPLIPELIQSPLCSLCIQNCISQSRNLSCCEIYKTEKLRNLRSEIQFHFTRILIWISSMSMTGERGGKVGQLQFCPLHYNIHYDTPD